MDMGYLSTAKEDKFDTAIVEFLAEGDEEDRKEINEGNTAS